MLSAEDAEVFRLDLTVLRVGGRHVRAGDPTQDMTSEVLRGKRMY